MGPFWARLGRLLGPFWEPKSGQVGPKINLEAVFVQKRQCSRNIGKRKARATFLSPRWAQDGLKTGRRRVQERSITHAFFVLIFDSFRGRLGVVLGPILGAKIDPKSKGSLGQNRSCFRSCGRLAPSWLQDRPKRAPGVVLGPSWGGLGPLLGALGPSLEGLGGLLGCLEEVLGCSWDLLRSSGTVLAAHEAINGSFWNAIR